MIQPLNGPINVNIKWFHRTVLYYCCILLVFLLQDTLTMVTEVAETFGEE
jgi:hypothetical protein